jgi:hypothetical protein
MKKFKPHKVDWSQIERFLQSAEKKLASAHKILAFDEEACLQQAYEAMVKAWASCSAMAFVPVASPATTLRSSISCERASTRDTRD